LRLRWQKISNDIIIIQWINYIWRYNLKVYALVGVSGTGKSYHALDIAQKHNIRYIIDDGLLIFDRRRIAGYSAKKENTYISAVKRALFFQDIHKLEVCDAIKKESPDKILVIGTSVRMVKKIVSRLELPEIDEYIMVEEILHSEDIKKARYHRDVQGKHVIPLPTVEIKKDFSGYFIDTVKSIVGSRRKELLGEDERTVVRPTFSYLGRYTISDKVIVEIVKYSSKFVEGLESVIKVRVISSKEIIIGVECSMKLGKPLNLVAIEFQKKIKAEVEEMTQLNIGKVNIFVKSLT